jgi:hypothetical protein
MHAGKVSKFLTDHFRCPEEVADSSATPELFGESPSSPFETGSSPLEKAATVPLASDLQDTFRQIGDGLFTESASDDPARVVESLRLERYAARYFQPGKSTGTKSAVRNMYYTVRPLMPVAVRKQLQRLYLWGWDKKPFPKWPVDRTVEEILEAQLVREMKSSGVSELPFIWFWPDGLDSAAIMTHDVETKPGVDFCVQLMDLNDSFGIKSSFQIVPEERYQVTPRFLDQIRERGFEVNVHDLNHDGHLFRERSEFLRRAERIMRYKQEFRAQGFRSAVLYRNADWFDALDFSYDMSIPNVAHLDPQRGGCCTVFPYFIGKLVELPVTTTQDYSLFNILNDYSIRLWKQQISLIREKHGLLSFIIHPDYIIDKPARAVYTELLRFLSDLRKNERTWVALPGDVAAWWRMRSAMTLTNVRGSWRIEGKGSERAKIAYALLVNNELVYELDRAPSHAAA